MEHSLFSKLPMKTPQTCSPPTCSLLGPYSHSPLPQVTTDGWRALHPSLPGINDLTNMFTFWDRVDQRASVSVTQTIHPGVQSLRAWAQGQTEALQRAMEQGEAHI